MVDFINQIDFKRDLDSHVHNKQPQNIQAFKLYVTDKAFIIEPNTRSLSIQTRLIIERYSKRIITEGLFIFVLFYTDLNDKCSAINDKTPYSLYSAFLGLLTINQVQFIVMAERVIHQPLYPVAPDFFQLYTTQFIPLPNIDFTLTIHGQQIMEHIQNIKQLLSQGYYFTFEGEKTSIDRNTFMWNQYLYRELYQQQIRQWDILLIQGFIHSFLIYLDGKRVQIALIARRSQQNAGTRQYDTGVNEDGNVANFVETEQIISAANLKCTHIQVRGSVPVFWKQKGMLIKNLEATASQQESQNAFEKHVTDLQRRYERVLAVNLMNHNKSMEKELIKQYELCVQQLNSQNVKYVYYNFDEHTQGYNFNIINSHVKQFGNMIRNLQFNAYDMKNNQCLLKQRGVLRTNCMACLDRTNVYQNKVALYILEFQLESMGINFQQICGQSSMDVVDDGDVSKCHPLVVSFRAMWADHGDYISQHYSGTGSMHSNQERQGQQSFMQILGSGLIPISRFYKTNFSEHIRQESIEILLGIHKVSKQQQELESLEKKLIDATSMTTYYNFSEEDLNRYGYEKLEIINQKKIGDKDQIVKVKGYHKGRWIMIILFNEEFTKQFEEESQLFTSLSMNLPNQLPIVTGTNKLKQYIIFDLGQSNLQKLNSLKEEQCQEWTESELLYIMQEASKILIKLIKESLYVSDLKPRSICFHVTEAGQLQIKLNVAEQMPVKLGSFPSVIIPEYMDPLVLEKVELQATALQTQESISNTTDLLTNDRFLVSEHEAEQAIVWMLGRVIYTTLFPNPDHNTNDIHIMVLQLDQMMELKQFPVISKLLKRILRANVVEIISNFDILLQEIQKALQTFKVALNLNNIVQLVKTTMK